MAKRDEEREKRLAAALRENLKRRKMQARREDAPATSSRRESGPMDTESQNQPGTVIASGASLPAAPRNEDRG